MRYSVISLLEDENFLDSVSDNDKSILKSNGYDIESLKVINLINDSSYKSQIDNKIIPYGTCNVTSMAMACELLNYDSSESPYNDTYTQLEDRMSNFMLNDDEIQRIFNSNSYKWYRDNNYEPMEIHALLSKAVNKFYGRADGEITYFGTNWTTRELVYDIMIKMRPFVTSGRFWKYNHVVCFDGLLLKSTNGVFTMNDPGDIDMDNVVGFIYDDPFGQKSTEYKNRNGNNQIMLMDEFVSIINNKGSVDNKWAHRFV